jgi:hypothetical protein
MFIPSASGTKPCTAARAAAAAGTNQTAMKHLGYCGRNGFAVSRADTPRQGFGRPCDTPV